MMLGMAALQDYILKFIQCAGKYCKWIGLIEKSLMCSRAIHR